MMPWERRRIAKKVRDKWYWDESPIKPATEEIMFDAVPLEVTFDAELTDLDRFFLRKWGIVQ